MTSAKIWFCGDTHGGFGHLIDAVRAQQPSAIILLGDIQTDLPLHLQLAELDALTQYLAKREQDGKPAGTAAPLKRYVQKEQ